MPCNFELLEPDSLSWYWYCCNCGDGPMAVKVSSDCTGCNNHKRCGDGTMAVKLSSACTGCNDHKRCGSDGFPVTLDDSPASLARTSSHQYKNDARHLDISKTASTPATCQANPCRDKPLKDRDNDSTTITDGPCESTSDTLSKDELPSLQTAIDQYMVTIINYLHSLAPEIDLALTPEAKSCPSGGQAAPRTPNPSAQRTPQQHSSKDNGKKREKKVPGGRKDDQESGDDVSGKPPDGGWNSDQENPPYRQLACPFVKYNPQRYRHEKTCGKGWPSASKLRHHLTRQDGSPHKLSDCNTCLQIFPTDEERDRHEKEGKCLRKAPLCPLEGIPSRWIREKTIPKGKSGHKATKQEVADWWEKLYHMINGEDAEMPDNIYHDADENVRRSNEPEHLDDFRRDLIRTLGRVLPKNIKDNAWQRHIKNMVEREVQRIKDLSGSKEKLERLPEDFSQRLDVQMSKRSSVGTSAMRANMPSQRHRPRNGSIDKACERPGESGTDAVVVPSGDLDDPATLPSDVRVYDKMPTTTANLSTAKDPFALERTDECTWDDSTYGQYGDHAPLLFCDLNVLANTSPQPQHWGVFAIEHNTSMLTLDPLRPTYRLSSSIIPCAPQEVQSLEDGPPQKRQRVSRENHRTHAALHRSRTLDHPGPQPDRIELGGTPTWEDFLSSDYNPDWTQTQANGDLQFQVLSSEDALFGDSAQSLQGSIDELTRAELDEEIARYYPEG